VQCRLFFNRYRVKTITAGLSCERETRMRAASFRRTVSKKRNQKTRVASATVRTEARNFV